MIKLSKKVTFFLLLAMTIAFPLTLRNVNWENVSENIHKELGVPSMSLSLFMYFFIYYIKIIKEENMSKNSNDSK